MTKEEGSVQLADAAWTLRGAFAKSHSINFPHPGGSGRQVTYNPVSQAVAARSPCSRQGSELIEQGYNFAHDGRGDI
jgi:hypothetical protein